MSGAEFDINISHEKLSSFKTSSVFLILMEEITVNLKRKMKTEIEVSRLYQNILSRK